MCLDVLAKRLSVDLRFRIQRDVHETLNTAIEIGGQFRTAIVVKGQFADGLPAIRQNNPSIDDQSPTRLGNDAGGRSRGTMRSQVGDPPQPGVDRRGIWGRIAEYRSIAPNLAQFINAGVPLRAFPRCGFGGNSNLRLELPGQITEPAPPAGNGFSQSGRGVIRRDLSRAEFSSRGGSNWIASSTSTSESALYVTRPTRG